MSIKFKNVEKINKIEKNLTKYKKKANNLKYLTPTSEKSCKIYSCERFETELIDW